MDNPQPVPADKLETSSTSEVAAAGGGTGAEGGPSVEVAVHHPGELFNRLAAIDLKLDQLQELRAQVSTIDAWCDRMQIQLSAMNAKIDGFAAPSSMRSASSRLRSWRPAGPAPRLPSGCSGDMTACSTTSRLSGQSCKSVDGDTCKTFGTVHGADSGEHHFESQRFATEPEIGMDPKRISQRRTRWTSSLSLKSATLINGKLPVTLLRRGSTTKRIWIFLEAPETGKWARWYVRCLMLIILASVIVPVLQTIQLPAGRPPISGIAAAVLEVMFDVVFAIETFVRCAVCPNRCAFFKSPYNIIDVAAVVPFVIRIAVDFELPAQDDGSYEWTTLLCVVPVLRLLKTLRHFETFQLLLDAFRMAFEALPVLLFTLAVTIMVFSSLIYISEPRWNIVSFPHAVWLTIITMTTVGYGDVTPTSIPGYVVISILTIFSALILAIPIGVVGNAFSRVWEDRDRLLLVQRTRTRLIQGGYKASHMLELFYFFSCQRREIHLRDFRRMMAELKVGISEERTIDLFRSFDIDGSGTINIREFVGTLFPSAYAALCESQSLTPRTEDDQRSRTSIDSTSTMAVQAVATA